MNNLEALLMVIIIVMLYIQYDKTRTQGEFKKVDVAAEPTAPVQAPTSAAPVEGMSDRDDYGRTANQENIDYYQTCGLDSGAQAPCSDPCSSDLEYAVHEYGGAGLDFKDWAAAQSIDPQVIKNHGEFIKDRLNNEKTTNITGRTYSPDSHESYNEVPWIGIRGRPQMVKQCNPQQMPDSNLAVYATEQRITWKSS